MTKRGKTGGKDDGPEIEVGGLFRQLGEAVDLLGKLVEVGAVHSRQGEFRVKGLGDKARGVYGFSIRTGLGGESGAQVERFGNVHPSREGFVVDEVREPLVDVFDEADEVAVTAELPGVTEAEITVEVLGDQLTVESKGERRYAKEITLPAEIDPATLQRKYNNGVLELRMRKKARP
ncbi:HSP20 family protein [Enhydrobacter aerosaccus]|uniref:HSP20 family protein n=1 Tax=Enhydrobacter aerosaccus TaxID=225324 RepID=A0A1T4LVS8_9HYPH|nr:Hsp20/alpha crystallin family protein [Enhydrobacter aerosaccus]SJZ58785.1 HSP20 family protein [Enhydrobacter aerosaccus]